MHTPGCFINAALMLLEMVFLSIEYSFLVLQLEQLHLIMTTCAACSEHSYAQMGGKQKIIGFLVFNAINDLKMTVEVGFVVGAMPQIT